MTTAINFYRAIQSAALVAPGSQQAADAERALCNARVDAFRAAERAVPVFWEGTRGSGAHMITRDAAEAMGEMLELASRCLAPKFLTFRHASGSVKLRNTRERLQAFAADMIKGSAWSLWGGGEKPAEAIKPKKARSAWNAAAVKVAAEHLQDGNAAEFLELATEQLGGLAYLTGSSPFFLYAPETAPELPEGFAVCRRCDGKYITTHIHSGLSVGNAEKTRRAALDGALHVLSTTDPEKVRTTLAAADSKPAGATPEALDAWRAAHGLQPSQAPAEAQQAEQASEAEQAQQASAPAAPRSPQADHEAARAAVASVRAIAQAKASSEQQSTPVRGLFAKSSNPDYNNSAPLAELDGIKPGARVTVASRTGGPWTVELLYRRKIAGFFCDLARLVEEGTGKRLDVLTSETQASEEAGELVTCDSPDEAATAAATPPAHTPPDLPGATGQADTPPAGQPEHCAGPLKTTAASLRAEFFAASGRGAAQKTASKTGAWRADFFRTERGSCALIFTGPDGVDHCSDYLSGADRIRALQAMARAAELIGTSTPGVGGVAHSFLKITFTRAEGLIDECDKPHTVHTFAQADSLLFSWSETAPKNGGYDKCDFEITWPDGNTYKGRYDLKHHTAERPSLTDHMVNLADFYTGKGCPDHMSAAAYEAAMQRTNQPTREAYELVTQHLNAQGIHTGRARPVSLDLRELVAAGLPVAQLVGLGVVYCGDAQTPAKSGAIVDAEASEGNAYSRASRAPAHLSNIPHIEVTIQTEDGATLTAWHDDFTDEMGARFRIDSKRHGAPYLAQLAAAVATRNAQATAAKQIEEQAHAAAVANLLVEFSHLERNDGQQYGGVFAAKNIRTELKRAFPGVKFSVKSSYSSVSISWTDGPTDAQVSEVVARFDIGASDTQSDYFYTVGTAFSGLFGGVQYLNTHRDTSDVFFAEAMGEWWAARKENGTAPTAQERRNAEGFFSWRTGCDEAKRSFREYLAEKQGPMKATSKTRKG